MAGAVIIPPMLASCCTVVSAFGVIILLVLGWGFNNGVEVLTGSTKDPEDPKKVAQLCYATALAYAVFFGVCGCQALTHARFSKQGQVRLR